MEFKSGRNMSPKQAEFANRLQQESPAVARVIAAVEQAITDGNTKLFRLWTAKEVRGLMDAMISLHENDPKRTDSVRKANRFSGKCGECGHQVAAGAGWVTRVSGKWVNRHNPGDCVIAAETAVPDDKLEGFWVKNEQVIKVQIAAHGSGRPYAKLLNTETGEFEYNPGLISDVRAGLAVRMSYEDAAKLGHLYGRCVCCGATLTDERSIEAGIGPVCGGRLRKLQQLVG